MPHACSSGTGDLRDTGVCPILDPGLAEYVLDVMKAAMIHSDHDRLEKGTRTMGRVAHLERSLGLLIGYYCRREPEARTRQSG